MLLYGSLEELDEVLEVVDIELGVELHAALLFHVVHDFLEGIDVGLRFGLHAEHNVASTSGRNDGSCPMASGVAALSARIATVASFMPRLRTVSIMPGIEARAPERNRHEEGLAGSLKDLPVRVSTWAIASWTSFSMQL